jgi:CO/xanthine dehydrogenase Mo-binding subunit
VRGRGTTCSGTAVLPWLDLLRWGFGGANLFADQATAAASWQPSVYHGFEPDGQIVVAAHRSEMGAGSRTSLPLVVAEELDVDWKTVRVDQAIGDTKFGSPKLGPL